MGCAVVADFTSKANTEQGLLSEAGIGNLGPELSAQTHLQTAGLLRHKRQAHDALTARGKAKLLLDGQLSAVYLDDVLRTAACKEGTCQELKLMADLPRTTESPCCNTISR